MFFAFQIRRLLVKKFDHAKVYLGTYYIVMWSVWEK